MDLQRVHSKQKVEIRVTPKELGTHFFLITVKYSLLILHLCEEKKNTANIWSREVIQKLPGHSSEQPAIGGPAYTGRLDLQIFLYQL